MGILHSIIKLTNSALVYILVYYRGLYSYNVLYNFHHSQLPFLVLACALKSTTWYFLFIMKVQIKSWNYHKIKIFQELWLYSGIFKMFIEYSRLVTKLLNIKKSWTVKNSKVIHSLNKSVNIKLVKSIHISQKTHRYLTTLHWSFWS